MFQNNFNMLFSVIQISLVKRKNKFNKKKSFLRKLFYELEFSLKFYRKKIIAHLRQICVMEHL